MDVIQEFLKEYAAYGYPVLFFGVLLENAGIPLPLGPEISFHHSKRLETSRRLLPALRFVDHFLSEVYYWNPRDRCSGGRNSRYALAPFPLCQCCRRPGLVRHHEPAGLFLR